MELSPTPEEVLLRDQVLLRVLQAIRAGSTIKLPQFDRDVSTPSESALLSIVNDPNPFCGTVAEFAYQFEGEEDLLHLFVVRRDGMSVAVEAAQQVALFALPGFPTSFFFLKPGEFSHHFYVGHDFLLEYCNPPDLK